jgi:hypothetical protein
VGVVASACPVGSRALLVRHSRALHVNLTCEPRGLRARPVVKGNRIVEPGCGAVCEPDSVARMLQLQSLLCSAACGTHHAAAGTVQASQAVAFNNIGSTRRMLRHPGAR